MKSVTIRGTVRRVFFANPESPAMAGVLEDEHGATVRFAGKCFANIGDILEGVGSWTHHPKFGAQFAVESGLVKMDESPDALVHLLASHESFKGLGVARARKVVDAALVLSSDGEASSALVEFPDEISERSGVSVEIVRLASEMWSSRKGFFDALARLTDQGWTNAQATKIVEQLGENAPAMVRADPYMLIELIPRFGFRTVDTVAKQLGIKSTSPMRLEAGIAYCLDQIASNGDTWTTRSGLLQSALEELRLDTLDAESAVTNTISDLVNRSVLTLSRSPIGDEIVSDSRLLVIETEVFKRLLAGLQNSDVAPLEIKSDKAREIVSSLNEGQLAALGGFSSRQFALISGGAGVGKTYMVKAIVELAKSNGIRPLLCAPTGRAAKKLANSTQAKASTIHRLLGSMYEPTSGTFHFQRNANKPLDTSLVILDESSMVDVRLFHSLLQALPDGCRLIMIGDHHQIPSVGAGAILRDVLSAKSHYPQSVHVLSKIVRHAGVLARNISAILDGVVVVEESPSWGIEWTEKGHEEGAAQYIGELVEFAVTSPAPIQPFDRPLDLAWDIQVLAPQRKGPLGTWALNTHLQRLRQSLLGNPPPAETEAGKPPKPLPGDRVIWTRNDYELDLYNGTQALVAKINKGGSMEIVTEDGREVTIPAAKRLNIEVAYAMTVHKSQGSEWPMVVLVGSSSHWHMHDRNLLYTGASRASESLTLVGDKTGLRHFAREQKSARRRTFGEFLVNGWDPKLELNA